MDLHSFLSGLEGLSEEDLEAVIVSSPAAHFATSVEIHNKSGEAINPVPNILQLRMSEVYEWCMANGVPCRMLVLKPRQVGCSTFAAHIVYHHEQRFRCHGLTISDVAANSQKLMEKVRDYQHADRYAWGNSIESTSKNIRYSHGSFHEIDSAENWKAGIGVTRQAFHASEVPKWPKTGVKNDGRVMAAVLPSIAKVPNTVVIAEGTADGASGWFYEAWQRGVTLQQLQDMVARGERKLVWIKVFAAWHEFDEHTRRTPDGDIDPVPAHERREIEQSLTEREVSGRALHGWTMEQIAWRRDIIRLECSGSEDVMDEYYPEDDVRCFLVSGRPRFHVGCLTAQDDLAKSLNPEIGFLVRQDTGMVTWSRSRDGAGDIKVWEHPRQGCSYVVSCDPAKGEDQTQMNDPDRTSIQVWRSGFYHQDRDSWVPAALVARLRGPFFGDSDESTASIIRLSKYYGHALCVPEVNMGLQILELLKLSDIPIYKRIVPGRKPGTRAEQLGWYLKDREQKRMLIEQFASGIREGALLLNEATELVNGKSVGLIHECKMFITDHGGKDCARAGEHDDDVMAAAMAFYCLDSAVQYRIQPRQAREPGDRDQWRRFSGGQW